MQRFTRIVIADDHPIFTEGIASLINSTDTFRITLEAEDGHQLLEMLKALSGTEQFPHICLLDINMPELNGYETMKYLSHDYPDLSVLVLSMFDATYNVINMLKLGAKGFITKGCKRNELIEALTYIRDGDFYISTQVAKTLKSSKAKEVPGLSERETEFLSHCHLDLSYKEIADKMAISERTIHTFRDNLFGKYNIRSRSGLIAFAFKTGIIYD